MLMSCSGEQLGGRLPVPKALAPLTLSHPPTAPLPPPHHPGLTRAHTEHAQQPLRHGFHSCRATTRRYPCTFAPLGAHYHPYNPVQAFTFARPAMHACSPMTSHAHHPPPFAISLKPPEAEEPWGCRAVGECSLEDAGHLHPLPRPKGSVSFSPHPQWDSLPLG